MKGQKRIRDYGIRIRELETGRLNAITDIEGVRIGHQTIDHGLAKTGVTVVIPSNENIFKSKLLAACHVIGGFEIHRNGSDRRTGSSWKPPSP